MDKLDLKDRKLLYWLDQNSRATGNELAKKIGLTPQATYQRMKRLQRRGIVKKYIAFINTLSLGYNHYKVFIKLHNTTPAIDKRIITALVKNSHIRWVGSLSGKYDLSFSVLAQNPQHFSTIYQEIEKNIGRYIQEKNIATVVSGPGFTRDFLLGMQEAKKRDYKPTKIQVLDHKDRKILSLLSQNAQENITSLATKSNLSVDIVKYRLKNLIHSGVISGFTLFLDREKLGLEYYSIFLYLHNLNPSVEESLLTFAQQNSNVLFIVKVIGNYDYQIELEVFEFAQLELFLQKFRKQFAPWLRDFEVIRLTKEYKYDFFPFNEQDLSSSNSTK